jgi:hypothetical protein
MIIKLNKKKVKMLLHNLDEKWGEGGYGCGDGR